VAPALDSRGRAPTCLLGAVLASAVAVSLVTAPGASAGPADAAKARAAIVLVPGPPTGADPSMLELLAHRDELALGFASSTLGSYSAEQALLDMSAGARTWTSLYDGDLPARMDVRPIGRGGVVTGWTEARARARTPPAEVVPGLLAQVVRESGRRTAYTGLAGRLNREAIVAADRAGRIHAVALTRPGAVASRALALWRRATLLVARLPAGEAGSRALAALLRERRVRDLVLVVQQPPPAPRRLLALGAAGLEGGNALRSDSTRTDGLVVATDLAPTVLRRLGLEVPDEMAGRPIEASGDSDVDELIELKDRLDEVGPRRWTVLLAGLGGATLIATLGTALWPQARRRVLGRAASGSPLGAAELGHTVLRAAFPAALWLPAAALATGALAPSRAGEAALLAVLCGVPALVSVRYLRWPAAIALPAAVTVIAHVVDLAFGSPLIARSLLGPNPILGARFYGVGNELEVTLGLVGLLGIGAALATAGRRELVWGFVVGGSTLAFLLSWGKLGADVGASIMLAAGTAAAAVLALGERPGRRGLAIVVIAPVLALAALAAVDLVTGGDAHFTRSVLRAGGLDEVADTAQRRLELSYDSLGRGLIGLLVGLAVGALVAGVRFRHRLLLALNGTPGVRAAAGGALVALAVGALTNDSGPIILLIGTVYLSLFTGYVWAVAGTAAEQRD
jgi:hypothetical protein